MRVARVAADAGVRSSERSRLRMASSATLAAAGSSMTHRSTMTSNVPLTNLFVNAFSPEFEGWEEATGSFDTDQTSNLRAKRPNARQEKFYWCAVPPK